MSDTVLRSEGLDARRLPSPPDSFPMWLIDTENFEPQSLEDLLCEDERVAANRFRRTDLRNRYIAAHGGLRVLLRELHHIPLDAQAIDRNRFGKPHLMRYPGLHYSISYSGQYVMVGVGEGEQIGVDVEVIRPIEDAAELMDMHFTAAEQAEVRSGGAFGTSSSRKFLEIWVRKEACLKAFGCGLNFPLNTVECALGDQMTTVQLSDSQFRTGALQYLGDPIMAWSSRISV
jgi:4'-phosphopantetheinyl transferase